MLGESRWGAKILDGVLSKNKGDAHPLHPLSGSSHAIRLLSINLIIFDKLLMTYFLSTTSSVVNFGIDFFHVYMHNAINYYKLKNYSDQLILF